MRRVLSDIGPKKTAVDMRRWKHCSLDGGGIVVVADVLGMFDSHDRTRCDRTRPASPHDPAVWGACGVLVAVEKKIAAEPELERNLKSVLEVRTAGDPDEEQIVWTEFSPTQIAEQVAKMGTPVSVRTSCAIGWPKRGLALHKIAKDVAGGRVAQSRGSVSAPHRRIEGSVYLDGGNPVFSTGYQGQRASRTTRSQGPRVDAGRAFLAHSTTTSPVGPPAWSSRMGSTTHWRATAATSTWA